VPLQKPQGSGLKIGHYKSEEKKNRRASPRAMTARRVSGERGRASREPVGATRAWIFQRVAMKNFALGVICAIAVLAVGGLAYLLLGFAEVRGDVGGCRHR
jgi:hypothetical protein